jgi:hypothetical protein
MVEVIHFFTHSVSSMEKNCLNLTFIILIYDASLSLMKVNSYHL